VFVSKTFAPGSRKIDKHLSTSYQQGGFALKIKGFREKSGFKKETRTPVSALPKGLRTKKVPRVAG